ncbi:hypothetical protein L1987_00459 [Smallanthus sonchifolius]|uniref:Uncharacterized protein n=1 Tax=Smallanthus sonchifolius TaxID=185202 RepID=A0ACB9K259_9ASTR|nr:hypothetical protein L1987_00459 [Smallanthus sonchifolius]
MVTLGKVMKCRVITGWYKVIVKLFYLLEIVLDVGCEIENFSIIKVKSLINFLKTNKPFGEVAADLYTIEFQKRGLPHCHLLLWVAETHRIKHATDIDNYISAEIPDPLRDPDLYKLWNEQWQKMADELKKNMT